MKLKEIWRLVREGGPGVCQIALTNACNAFCRFCSFPQVPSGERVMADPGRLKSGLEALRQGNVHYVSFTGGEPLLYPALGEALAQARELGFHTMVCTNGALLTPRRIKELAEVGLETLIISVDAAGSQEHDDNRGLPGLSQHIRDMVPPAREAGLHLVASVTLSRLVKDLRPLARFVWELGFRQLTFSYPLTTLNSSYLGYAPRELVGYSPGELDELFEEIKALKAGSPVAILNPRLALTDLQRQLRGHSPRFPCLAGYKYFFVDWHLTVFRCHFLEHTLGVLEDFPHLPRVRDNCHACTIDCYRDPSVFQYLPVSVADGLAHWGKGQWLKGLSVWLHPYNFLSLAALLEGRHWLPH